MARGLARFVLREQSGTGGSDPHFVVVARLDRAIQ
jgi:hypothetical protein